MADGEIPRKSDLPVRAASALVMVAVAGLAVALGGSVWALFVALIATGVYYEWAQLARGFAD
ncbi:MAG: phosphatidate cytidylyltransferase, partial [Sphingomonadales bacterium]|nr:phosphatidate cytidylyltransferase [Sphingomonadales bacterium]